MKQVNIIVGQNDFLWYDVAMKNHNLVFMGNPDGSLSGNRVEVKCSICEKVKSVSLFDFNKNTNGNRTNYTRYFKTLLSGQEPATTIPQGSTPQANGGGSAEYPFPKMGNDIVCSSGKPEAVS